MDTISNIFENFYNNVCKQFLTEARAGENKKPVSRKFLVSYKDDMDKKLKAELLSDEDNLLKTKSILSFLLSGDLYDYFIKSIFPLVPERKYIKPKLDGNANYRPSYDEMKENATRNLKSYWDLFRKSYTKYMSKHENSSIGEQTYYDDVFISSNKWDTYVDKINEIAKFYNLYVVGLNIANKFGQRVMLNTTKNRDNLRITLRNDPYFCNADHYSYLSARKTLKLLKNNGFTDAKLRDCPAFTTDMNTNDNYEMSFGLIKSPILNVFDPSEINLSGIRAAVKDKKSFSDAFQFTPLWRTTINNVLSAIETTSNAYIRTKCNDLRSIVTFFDQPVTSVTDALIKLEKVIDFIQDTSLTDFEADQYTELKQSKSTNVQFKEVEQLKKSLNSHLIDLSPFYIEIATLAQLLFSNVNSTTKNQSIKRLYDPATNKMINFIVPTKDLKKTIDLDRMELSFFNLSSSNEKTLDRPFDALLSNIIYNPIYVTSKDAEGSQQYSRLVAASNKIQSTLNKLLTLDNGAKSKGAKEKTYYIDNQNLESFIEEARKSGAKIIDGNEIDIGTYVNNNMNYNVVVVFEHLAKHEPITQKNVWKHTRVTKNTANFDGNGYRLLTITTPIYPMSMEFNLIASKAIDAADVGGNFTSDSDEVLLKKLNLKDTDEFFSKKDEVARILSKEILNYVFDHVFAKNVKKGDDFDKALFDRNKKEAFLDKICLNLQFDEKDLDNASTINALANYIMNFFIRPDVWKLILYTYIYYSLMMAPDADIFDFNGVKSSKSHSTPEKKTEPNVDSIDRYEQIVEGIMKAAAEHFSSSVNSKVNRTIVNILSDEKPLYENSNFRQTINSVINSIIDQNYVYGTYERYIQYIKKNESKIPNFLTLMSDLKNAVEAAIQPNLSAAVNVKMSSGFDLVAYNQELNKIGEFFIEVTDKLIEQNQGFPYELTFENSKNLFISLMYKIGTLRDKEISHSLYVVIKMFLYITYILYLVLTVCKSKPQVFLVARAEQNIAEKNKSDSNNSVDMAYNPRKPGRFSREDAIF